MRGIEGKESLGIEGKVAMDKENKNRGKGRAMVMENTVFPNEWVNQLSEKQNEWVMNQLSEKLITELNSRCESLTNAVRV